MSVDAQPEVTGVVPRQLVMRVRCNALDAQHYAAMLHGVVGVEQFGAYCTHFGPVCMEASRRSHWGS